MARNTRLSKILKVAFHWFDLHIVHKDNICIVCMSLVQELQTIKKKHDEDMVKLRQDQRRKEKLYYAELTKCIVNAIKQKHVCNGNHIQIYMRMDEERSLSVVETNALLAEHYIKVNNIYVNDTLCNGCTVNPVCCCCCPCIFFPKVAINALFGTLYQVDVYLDI